MGSPRTLVHDAIFSISADSATLGANATVNGAAFDRQNSGNAAHELVVLLDVGAWTDGVHTFHLEDSPDNSVWTDVVAADVIAGDGLSGLASVAVAGQIVVDGAPDDAAQYLFGYMGTARYVRLSVVSTGVTVGLAGVISWFVAADPRDNVR